MRKGLTAVPEEKANKAFLVSTDASSSTYKGKDDSSTEKSAATESTTMQNQLAPTTDLESSTKEGKGWRELPYIASMRNER
jgi:hypothetical protein